MARRTSSWSSPRARHHRRTRRRPVRGAMADSDAQRCKR
jgi:hypothetical protein